MPACKGCGRYKPRFLLRPRTRTRSICRLLVSSIDRHEAAQILQWSGAALILVFLVNVLFAAYPFAVARPEWQLQLSNQLRGGASFALVGALLMLIALQLDSDTQPLSDWLRTFRKLSLVAAIGYLLLIPLQTAASLGVARATNGQERQVFRILNQKIQAVRNADTEEKLREAISSLPGAPSLRGRSFGSSVPDVRRRVLEQVEPQARRLEATIQERERARIFGGLQNWIRDALISACYALGFAGLAKAGSRERSLLEILLRR